MEARDERTHSIIGAAMDVHRVLGIIVVEAKALAALGTIEDSPVINYLKVSTLRVALLLNFGGGSLVFKRFAN